MIDFKVATLNTAVVLSIAIAAVWYFRVPLPAPDAFHSGEFLAAAISILQGAPYAGDPYTIHGAADTLPALIVSRFVSSPDFLLPYTLIVYPFLAVLSVILAIAAALKLARNFGLEPVQMIPFIMLAPLCVGWRDLFFVLSLFIFVQLVLDDRGSRWRLVAHIAFGLVVALGTYWSFNRGVLTIAAFGPPTLWLAVRDRWFALSIASAIAGFLFIGVAVPGVSIMGYFENFNLLLDTSENWEYEPTLTRHLWAGLIVAIASVAIGLVAHKIRRGKLSLPQILVQIALVIATLFYARIGLGRVGQLHFVMAAWMPLLIVNLLSPPVPFAVPSLKQLAIICIAGVCLWYFTSIRVGALPVAMIVLLASGFLVGERIAAFLSTSILAVCLAVVLLTVGQSTKGEGQYAWLLRLHTLPPADEAVRADILWSANAIRDGGSSCVFDLSNSGLINAVANLPACSRYTYPVYAGPDQEDQLISDLLKNMPQVLVYRADRWSYNIDGRSMQVRFPRLDAEILRLYPREECFQAFCLRFLD